MPIEPLSLEINSMPSKSKVRFGWSNTTEPYFRTESIGVLGNPGDSWEVLGSPGQSWGLLVTFGAVWKLVTKPSRYRFNRFRPKVRFGSGGPPEQNLTSGRNLLNLKREGFEK
jgi:hypothetical protein